MDKDKEEVHVPQELALSHQETLPAQPKFGSDLAEEIFKFHCMVRADPKCFIPYLEQAKTRYFGTKLKFERRPVVRTKEGVAAVDDAIVYL